MQNDCLLWGASRAPASGPPKMQRIEPLTTEVLSCTVAGSEVVVSASVSGSLVKVVIPLGISHSLETAWERLKHDQE